MSTSSDPEPRGPLVAQDVLRLDLREQPTPAEAGFAEGRNSVVFERVGEAIDTEITLPGGILSVDAFGVALSGPLGDQAPGAVELVVINRRLPDVDAVREALVEDAGVLGLDPQEVTQWAAQVGGAASARRAFEGRTADPSISIETRPSSGEDSWTVNYSFDFGRRT